MPEELMVYIKSKNINHEEKNEIAALLEANGVKLTSFDNEAKQDNNYWAETAGPGTQIRYMEPPRSIDLYGKKTKMGM